MIPIKLLKAHTHAGTEYPAGAIINVEQDTADYLVQYGIGAVVDQKDTVNKGGSK
jgi:hypothetical protein